MLKTICSVRICLATITLLYGMKILSSMVLGRTNFEREDIIIEIFTFRIEKAIKCIINYWFKNINQFDNNISQDDILNIFPEFVLIHELVHVWQVKRMGLDNYRLMMTKQKIDVDNNAYCLYERCADKIAKSIIVIKYGEIGRQVADMAIKWHRNEMF